MVRYDSTPTRYRDPFCSSVLNMGFDGSVMSSQRSRDPKRRDERICHGTKVDYPWIRPCILRVGVT